MMLTILLIASAIVSLILFIGYVWNKEDLVIAGWISVGVVIFVGWFVMGLVIDDHKTITIHKLKNLEILKGENKVFVTNKITNKTFIFEDAKTFNLVKDTTKTLYYIEIIKYSMYGIENNDKLTITDTITQEFKQ